MKLAILVQQQKIVCYSCNASGIWAHQRIKGENWADVAPGTAAATLQDVLQYQSERINQPEDLRDVDIHLLYASNAVEALVDAPKVLRRLHCNTWQILQLELLLEHAAAARSPTPEEPLEDTNWLKTVLLPILSRTVSCADEASQAQTAQRQQDDLASYQKQTQETICHIQEKIEQGKTKIKRLGAALRGSFKNMEMEALSNLEKDTTSTIDFLKNELNSIDKDYFCRQFNLQHQPMIDRFSEQVFAITAHLSVDILQQLDVHEKFLSDMNWDTTNAISQELKTISGFNPAAIKKNIFSGCSESCFIVEIPIESLNRIKSLKDEYEKYIISTSIFGGQNNRKENLSATTLRAATEWPFPLTTSIEKIKIKKMEEKEKEIKAFIADIIEILFERIDSIFVNDEKVIDFDFFAPKLISLEKLVQEMQDNSYPMKPRQIQE